MVIGKQPFIHSSILESYPALWNTMSDGAGEVLFSVHQGSFQGFGCFEDIYLDYEESSSIEFHVRAPPSLLLFLFFQSLPKFNYLQATE